MQSQSNLCAWHIMKFVAYIDLAKGWLLCVLVEKKVPLKAHRPANNRYAWRNWCNRAICLNAVVPHHPYVASPSAYTYIKIYICIFYTCLCVCSRALSSNHLIYRLVVCLNCVYSLRARCEFLIQPLNDDTGVDNVKKTSPPLKPHMYPYVYQSSTSVFRLNEKSHKRIKRAPVCRELPYHQTHTKHMMRVAVHWKIARALLASRQTPPLSPPVVVGWSMSCSICVAKCDWLHFLHLDRFATRNHG